METDSTNSNEKRIEKLRQMLKDAEELCAQNESLMQEDLNKVEELWKELEAILKEAKRSGNQSVQEMILDLQIMCSTSSYVGRHIRGLQTTVRQFSPIDYAEKLVARFSENGEIDWWKMSDNAVRIINRAPGIPLLLGTFGSTKVEIKKVVDERKKTVVPRVLKAKEVIAEKQTATKVENLSEDKDSVEVKVNHIKTILERLFEQNDNRPISYYRFVLHPSNFTATVENIFYISFLIKDGLALLGIDCTDELVISPLQKEVKTSERPEAKNQMVFSITMAEWRSLVTEYDVREPLIQF